MSRPYVRSIKPNEAKDIFGNISQSNHYQVSLNGLTIPVSKHIRDKFGVSNPEYFMGTKGNLLCSEASLPTSNLATGEVKGDFMGVPQQFVHTRLYTEVDFTFYVDKDYTNLKIFEGWMDYISSGSEDRERDRMDERDDNYYRRMRYPNTYKVQSLFISKFEKDYKRQLDYQFINAFPKLLVSIPVSYGDAQVLKISVQFSYDRYILNPKGRILSRRSSDITQQLPNDQTIETKTPELQQRGAGVNKSLLSGPFQEIGNTYGAGTDFVERDQATGVRADGGSDGPLLYPNGTPVYNPDGSIRNSQWDP